MTDDEIYAARVRMIEDERAAAVREYDEIQDRVKAARHHLDRVTREGEAAWARLQRANAQIGEIK